MFIIYDYHAKYLMKCNAWSINEAVQTRTYSNIEKWMSLLTIKGLEDVSQKFIKKCHFLVH